MEGRGFSRATLTAVVVALATVGCATTSPHHLAIARAPFAVIVDGRPTPGLHGTLLDLLRTRPSSSGLLAQAAASGGEPLLIVDGQRVIGTVRRLAQIPVADVARVTTLRSLDAFKQYGIGAHGGAILVETKKGR